MPPTAPIPPSWPIPKFDLLVEDFGHEGASIFFDVINPVAAPRSRDRQPQVVIHPKDRTNEVRTP
jgi:hypothetical protein